MVIIDPRAVQLQADLMTVFVDAQRAQVADVPMLAHYTSQAALASILATREIWLSDAKDMNDIDEIRGGAALIASVLEEIGPAHLQSVQFQALGVAEAFKRERAALEAGTYVFSLSDHGRNNEADRVAMWGLYGHNGEGVCAVFKSAALLGQNARGLFPIKWAQVSYGNRATVTNAVASALDKLDWAFRKNAPVIRDTPAHVIGQIVAKVAMTLVPAHKHSSFEAEREIRFVHAQPLQLGPLPQGAGVSVKRDKNVFVLPLRRYPEYGVSADLSDLLDHVIVEPSDAMDANAATLRSLLDANGLEHVEVRKSDSPFRRR